MEELKRLYAKLNKTIEVKSFKNATKIPLEEFLSRDIVLDEFQNRYIEEAFYRGLTTPQGFDTLNGGAGVGKTLTQSKLIQKFLSKGYKVLVLAPTHQALKVIKDKLPIKSDLISFSTVAKATKATISISHKTGEKNFYAKHLELANANVVFLDEGSFIDENEVRVILVGCLTSGVRLFVSGDGCQLPKPKSASICQFMDNRYISPDRNCYMTTLKKVYRTDGLGILALSDLIRDKWVLPEMRGLNYTIMLSYIVHFAKAYNDISVFNKTEESMRYIHELVANKNGNAVYLAYTNKCIDDLARYNLARQYKQGKTNHPYFPKGSLWYATAPLIENDNIVMQNGEYLYIHGVVNTKTMHFSNTVLKVCELQIEQVAIRQRRFVYVIHPDSLEDYENLLESFNNEAKAEANVAKRKNIWKQKQDIVDSFLAIKYAPFMTGHKSQGSEFPVVIIDLKDVMRVNVPFVLNRLFYVMITRAVKQLIFMV